MENSTPSFRRQIWNQSNESSAMQVKSFLVGYAMAFQLIVHWIA